MIERQALVEESGGDQRSSNRHQVEEQRRAAGPQAHDGGHPQPWGQHRGRNRRIQDQRNVAHVQAGPRRNNKQRKQHNDRHQNLHIQQLQGRQAQLPFLQQGAVDGVGRSGDQNHCIPAIDALLHKPAQITGRHHHDHAGKRQQGPKQCAKGQTVTQAGNRQPQRHHRHKGLNDPHVGGGGHAGCEIRQALVHRHAQHTQDDDLAQYRPYKCTVLPYRAEHERREQQAGQQPAIKADLGREDHFRGGLGNDGIGCPDQDGQQGKCVLHGVTDRKPEWIIRPNSSHGSTYIATFLTTLLSGWAVRHGRSGELIDEDARYFFVARWSYGLRSGFCRHRAAEQDDLLQC
ncbi:hypothetical protein ALQ04_05444 [Pseudomonas cichorii]|uniref:Uncharacterized protein n=1 Tax=Pseudomonas cichorii TaxID=36746 RepID=A0A3M4MA55_PSECI|nr:hypothetical protein ALQ04_05444 [Pseudomonas cichorii]